MILHKMHNTDYPQVALVRG